MTKNFVFESIDESINSEALYLGKKSYLFDMDTGEILFKTKYRYEEFSHYCQEFAFYIGKYVYITDRYGNRLFKTELKIYNQFKKHEEELYKYSKSKNIEEKQDKILFKNNGKYDYIRKCLYDKKDYFIVKKNGLYALIDGLENTLVDFKYSSFYANYFEKFDKLLFVVQNPQTKLFGIIDINENIVIPFIYDDIYVWNIYQDSERIGVEKNKKSAVVDLNNNILIDFQYKYIYDTTENYNYSFAQAENNLWGVIDRNGNSLNFDLSKVKEINITSLKEKSNKIEKSYKLNELMSFKNSISYKPHKRIKNTKPQSTNQLKIF